MVKMENESRCGGSGPGLGRLRRFCYSMSGKMADTVVAAMSGGVDSSVAAFLLKEQGYEVIGLTMDLYDLKDSRCDGASGRKGCCGWQAKEDAARAAASLGIPHYVVDLRREFEEAVVSDFCREYGLGRTPNPCVRCNEHIKFKALTARASRLGARWIATGHYARTARDPSSGRIVLRKGRDPAKDQSYFLYALTQDQLGGAIFPVGELAKADVRRIARKLGLKAADAPESQEICFVPDRRYAAFVASRCPAALEPGPILDGRGRVLGRHQGILNFTIGQRKGLGIAAPNPLYVLKIDAGRQAVIVGSNEGLYQTTLFVERVNFIAIDRLREERTLKVRIRYRHAEAEARVTPESCGRVRVEFAKPQRAVTPGQSAVFYDGDVVVGGGIIRPTR